MKKLILFTVTIMLSTSLIGCGKNSSNNGISLNANNISLLKFENFTLESDTSGITWESSDNNVATVDQNGVVTPINYGDAIITASNGTSKGTCDVHIVKEYGTYHSVNEPNMGATNATIKSLTSKSNTDTKLYRIRGIMEQNTYQDVGVFTISDETDYIEVYGASSTTTSIKNSYGMYTYTELYDFKKLDSLIHAGDELVIEGIYTVYESAASGLRTKEFKGYVVGYTSNYDTIPIVQYKDPISYEGAYYSTIDMTKTGNDLCADLQELMFSTHTKWNSYSSLPNNFSLTGEKDESGMYTCFYSGAKVNSVSREHIWCQSLSIGSPSSKTTLYGTTYAGADLHHIRPVINSINTTRSNKKYTQFFGKQYRTINTDYTTDIKYNDLYWEVPDDIKGDVARIVLYIYMHYNTIFSTKTYEHTGPLCLRAIVAATNETQALRLLKYWNAIDPVDEKERTRNEGAFNKQGNRNPFIDYPTLVDQI